MTNLDANNAGARKRGLRLQRSKCQAELCGGGVQSGHGGKCVRLRNAEGEQELITAITSVHGEGGCKLSGLLPLPLPVSVPTLQVEGHCCSCVALLLPDKTG